MKRYNDDFIKKIRKVREVEKLSFVQLGARFNVPPTTIGNWCQDIVGTRWDTLINTNENRRRLFRNSEKSVVPDIGQATRDQAKLLAGILYGCEGSKYPASRGLHFSNSDPNLILTFLTLLRKAFDLEEEKLYLHLQVHTTQNYQVLRDYWSGLLGISEDRFIKPTIKEPKGGKHRNEYKGTCTLRYGDYRIQLKLLGIFEKFVTSL